MPTLIEPLGPAADGFRVPAPSSSSSFVHDDDAAPVADESPNMPAAGVCYVPPESDQPLTAPALLASMRYRIQFTADQAYVDMIERARDLLGHQVPDRDLAITQRLAIEALLDELNRRKYGAAKFFTPCREAGQRRAASASSRVRTSALVRRSAWTSDERARRPR